MPSTAILAVVGVPAYQSFIAKGKSAKCVSNLRQLATVVQDYILDYGHYPAQGTKDADGKWAAPPGFYPYAGICQDPSWLVCPAAEYHGVNAGTRNWTRWQAACGGNPAMMPAEGGLRPPPRPTRVTRPSEAILLADSQVPGSSLTSHGFPGPLMPKRRGGRANVLFCDDHVTSITNVTQIKQKNLYWNY